MKDFDEIKKLWHVQEKAPGIGFDTLLKAVKSSGRGYAQKMLLQAVIAATLLLLLLAVWLFMPFVTWTTHLSLFIITACLTYYLTMQFRDYFRINQHSALLDQPESYIQYLKAYKASRYRFNTRNYTMYLFCICLAIAIYAIEMYFIMPTWVFYSYLLGTAIWIFACYFMFMKAYIKRENERLQRIIGHLENIRKQFQ